MRDEALQRDVLIELGDDRVQELAGELGTDIDRTRQVVEATVCALPGTIGTGTMVGILDRLTGPTAETVARQAGLPLGSVTRALELLLPVVLSVVAERRQAQR